MSVHFQFLPSLKSEGIIHTLFNILQQSEVKLNI